MTISRAFLLVLLLVQAAPSAEIKTLKGESIKGDLVSVSPKEIVIDVAGKKVATAVDQVLTLSFVDAVAPLGADVKFILVELTDGSQLKCASLGMKGKTAKLVLLEGQNVTVPIADVNYILNEAHLPAHVKDFKEKVIGLKSVRDVVALKNKAGVTNAIEGTFGDADAEGKTIEFFQRREVDGKEVEAVRREVPIDAPVAMYFRRGANPLAKPILCRLHDTSKNIVFVSELKREADGFSLVTSAGVAIKYAAPSVARLDYSTGKLVYLSSLTPNSVKETSAGGTVEPYRRDENLDGGKIKLAGIEYKFGLAMHSTTDLTYDLDGEYRELKAVVGIDDEVGGADEATVLKVYGDGVELVNWAISRKDKERARNLILNIKDVKKLRILVTTTDITDLGKHLTLADVRVSK